VFDHEDRKTLHKILHEVECIHEDVKRLLRYIALHKIDFIQVGGNPMNYSIQAGSSGTFQAVFTPPNGTQAPGTSPSWSCSDPSIGLTPSADGTSVVAAVPASNTASFTLTLSATSSDPTQGVSGVLTAVHTITVTQPPPPPTPLTGVDFVQTAG
jgi:hypothetical protein